MMRRVQEALILVIGIFPASKAKSLALRMAGLRVDPSARMGPCLLVGIRELRLEAGARIGSFNVFRHLQLLHVLPGGVIGQWNWVSASPELISAGGAGKLTLGAESA